MGAVLGGTFFLVAVIILPGISFYFDVTPKVVALQVGTAVALTLVAVRKPQSFSRVDRRFMILLLGLWVSLAAASLFSANPALSIGGTNWRRLGLISWTAILGFTALCAAYAAGRPDRIRYFLRVSVAAGTLASLYGILQFFGTDPILPADAYRVGAGEWAIVRTPGLMGHAAYHAIYLLLPLFGGAALGLTEPRRLWRIWGTAASVLAGVAIVFSGTRAAILGGLLGWLCLGFVLRRRIRTRAIVAASVLTIAGVAFYLSPAGQQLRSRTRWFVEDPLGGPRLMMWRDSLRMSAARHHLGAGLETFTSEFPKVQSAELARRFPDFHHESPHNIFIDALTEQGIPGIFLLAAIVVYVGMSAWRSRETHPELAAALGACLLAVVVAHQFTSFTTPTALMFFVITALLIALRCMSDTAETKPSRVHYATRFVALSAAAVLSFFAVRLATTDWELHRVRQEIEAGKLREATASYGRVGRHQLPGMSADLWYSRAMAKAAQDAPTLLSKLEGWREAMNAAARATDTSEEPHNSWYSLAMLAAAQNDSVLTERALRNAISAAPHWYKPRWILAKLLQLTGRQEEAKIHIAAAVELSGDKHAELRETRTLIEHPSARQPERSRLP